MKKCIFLFIVCFGVGPVHAQITLQSCQEKARANYPLIKQFDLISKSTEYNLSNASKAYLPQVSLTGIGAYIFKGLPKFSLPGAGEPANDKAQFIGIGQINQTIYDGGATRTQKEIIKAGAEVEKASVEVALNAIKERINQIYFGILLMDEQIRQVDILHAMADRNLQAITLTKNNGLAFQTDVDELKSEILTMEQRKIEFTFSRKAYVEMLSYLTGEPLTENVQLERPAIIELNASLANNRPELLLYANQRKLSQAQSSIDRVYNMPKVGLLGAGVMIEPGVSFGPSTLSSLAIGGLSVSWNSAGLYKSSNNRQLSRIQLEKISNQEEIFLFNTNLQLKQTNNDIEKQKSILVKDRELVELKTKIRDAYQIKYDNGACAMNDLIRTMNKESEAKSQEAFHQTQLLMSLYQYQTTNGN